MSTFIRYLRMYLHEVDGRKRPIAPDSMRKVVRERLQGGVALTRGGK